MDDSNLYSLVEQNPYDAQNYLALFAILKEDDDLKGKNRDWIMCKLY